MSTYLEVYSDNDAIVAALKGPLNVSTANNFQERVDELLGEETIEHLILDFSDAEYVSAIGLKVILDLGKRLKAFGATMSLVSPQPLVREIFAASGFTMLFGLYESIGEAQEKGLNHNIVNE